MVDNDKTTEKELPKNFGALGDANANARITGPCGDTMEFWLKIENNQISAASFTTDGCENSILCGSVAGYMVQNKPIDVAYALTKNDVLMKIGYELPEEFKHCAVLSVNAIKQAIESYKETQQSTCPAEKSCDNNCDSCANNSCDSSLNKNFNLEQKATKLNNTQQIKHKIAILSGKGGVGKSTVATNLAFALVAKGYKVGLMDVDICGPSIPTLLNLNNVTMSYDPEGIIPMEVGKLKVISIGFFLENPNDPLIWRGPIKAQVVDQFLHEVMWGDLDFLVIDMPPGTGDEPLSIGQSFSPQDSAIIVTTPQEVALADVRKSINFCHKLGLSILGVIENMSGFVCPKCGEVTEIFGSKGGKQLADDFNISLLGEIPIDPMIVSSCDKGECYINAYSKSKTAEIFKNIVDDILKRTNIN